MVLSFLPQLRVIRYIPWSLLTRAASQESRAVLRFAADGTKRVGWMLNLRKATKLSEVMPHVGLNLPAFVPRAELVLFEEQ